MKELRESETKRADLQNEITAISNQIVTVDRGINKAQEAINDAKRNNRLSAIPEADLIVLNSQKMELSEVILEKNEELEKVNALIRDIHESQVVETKKQLQSRMDTQIAIYTDNANNGFVSFANLNDMNTILDESRDNRLTVEIYGCEDLPVISKYFNKPNSLCRIGCYEKEACYFVPTVTPQQRHTIYSQMRIKHPVK